MKESIDGLIKLVRLKRKKRVLVFIVHCVGRDVSHGSTYLSLKIINFTTFPYQDMTVMRQLSAQFQAYNLQPRQRLVYAWHRTLHSTLFIQLYDRVYMRYISTPQSTILNFLAVQNFSVLLWQSDALMLNCIFDTVAARFSFIPNLFELRRKYTPRKKERANLVLSFRSYSDFTIRCFFIRKGRTMTLPKVKYNLYANATFIESVSLFECTVYLSNKRYNFFLHFFVFS